MIRLHSDSTWVTIDLDAIDQNFDTIRKKAGCDIMTIIKADAYGHGAIPIARLLQEKSAFFGVSSISEALELRKAGLTIPILILGYTPVSNYETAIAQAEREKQVSIKQSEAEAERVRIQAEAKAQSMLIAAQAEADAVKLAADAEAYRMENEGKYITDELIEKTIAENWDGKLPVVSGSGNAFLDVSSIIGAETNE